MLNSDFSSRRCLLGAGADGLQSIDRHAAGDQVRSVSGESHAETGFRQLEYRGAALTRGSGKDHAEEHRAARRRNKSNQIYARLSAGPIPDGPFEGDLFFPTGSSGKLRLSEIAGGGLKAFAVKLAGKKLDFIGETLWKGKVFYRDQRVLRNRIEDIALLQKIRSATNRSSTAISRRYRESTVRQGAMADVSRQALLRTEPARRPARIDHHRLCLHR